MQELIAKDANGELSSPELTSPDHWGYKSLPYPDEGKEPPSSRANDTY